MTYMVRLLSGYEKDFVGGRSKFFYPHFQKGSGDRYC